MEQIKEGEIVYAHITVKDEKGSLHELRKIVFSREWKCKYPLLEKDVYTRFLKQNNIKTNATIVDIKIIERTGFKHKNKGYTSVKQNEQIRIIYNK